MIGSVARLTILNMVGLVLLSAAWRYGIIGQVLAVDDVYVSRINACLFLVGLFLAFRAVWVITTMGSYGAAPLKLRIQQLLTPIRHIANTLVMLGLVGTTIGFIIALSGVDPAAATDVAKIGPMISVLLHGMAMSLFKTLVGMVLNIWLMITYRVVEHVGATYLIAETVVVREIPELTLADLPPDFATRKPLWERDRV